MPELVDRQELFTSKSLARRRLRSDRARALEKYSWKGKALSNLRKAENAMLDAINGPGKSDPDLLCRLVKTWLSMLDTRRVLVGDPLPGALRPDRSRSEAWREHALEALPCPVSISAPQATGEKPPEFAHTQSVQSSESHAITLDAQGGGSGS